MKSKLQDYFRVDPFPTSIRIMTRRKQFVAEMKRLGVMEIGNIEWPKYGARVNLLQNDDGGALIWILINAKTMAEEPIGRRVNVYSHEATHVLQYIMEHIEEEDPGDEVAAYCVGFITERIYDTLESAIAKLTAPIIH